MEKTEMMKRFEEKTGKQAMYWTAFGPEISQEYLDVIESKAATYDRLMSGNATIKELANIISHPVAIDSDGNLFMYYNTPSIGVDSDGDGGWWDVLRKPVKLPRWFTSYDGNWEDSLTLPDGWEEK